MTGRHKVDQTFASASAEDRGAVNGRGLPREPGVKGHTENLKAYGGQSRHTTGAANS